MIIIIWADINVIKIVSISTSKQWNTKGKQKENFLYQILSVYTFSKSKSSNELCNVYMLDLYRLRHLNAKSRH